jgi:hypothetical protein
MRKATRISAQVAFVIAASHRRTLTQKLWDSKFDSRRTRAERIDELLTLPRLLWVLPVRSAAFSVRQNYGRGAGVGRGEEGVGTGVR